MALIYGILAWPLVAAFAARLFDSPNRWRWIGGGLAAGVVVGTLLAGDNLTGAMIVAIWMAVGVARRAVAGAQRARCASSGS